MKQSDLNHLRRLLGWIRCDIGQSPAELQQTMIDVADGLGHPEISQDARARMVEAYHRAESIPLYVRAAVKALEKALPKLRTEGMQADAAAADTTLPDVLPELTTDGGAQYVSMATMQAVLRAARAMLHAPIAGEEQKPAAEVVSRYGDPEEFGERDLKVLVDLNSYPYGAKFYAAPLASEADAMRQAIKTCGSKVIKALAAIARADGPDTRKADDPELIYRSPVMDEVVRIRQAYDELERALKNQADKVGAQSPANRPESLASIESKGGALDGGGCAKGAGDDLRKLAAALGNRDWKWWDSCSFRRLTFEDGPHRQDGSALHGTAQASDGHPDIQMAPGVREFIEAASPKAIAALIATYDTALAAQKSEGQAC